MKYHPPVRIFFSTLLASPVKNFQLSRDSAVSGLGRVFNSTRVRKSTQFSDVAHKDSFLVSLQCYWG